MKEAPVDISKLNAVTPAAFIAIEDRRFYRHWGIDPRGIARAVYMRAGYADVLADIHARDQRDSSREAAPLKPAADAILLDTSALSVDEAIAEAIRVAGERILYGGDVG